MPLDELRGAQPAAPAECTAVRREQQVRRAHSGELWGELAPPAPQPGPGAQVSREDPHPGRCSLQGPAALLPWHAEGQQEAWPQPAYPGGARGLSGASGLYRWQGLTAVSHTQEAGVGGAVFTHHTPSPVVFFLPAQEMIHLTQEVTARK